MSMKMSKKQIYIFSFMLPLVVMIGCMVGFQVQPFGDHSFLIIDGLHQYMPFFSVLYDKLKGGESLFYSFRAGLGINFLSLFSYYLSSPLNLFILFFRKTQLNMAVSLLIVLKIALSGLMVGIYFTSRTKKPGITVLMVSIAYALNSYMVGYCWNVMWLDAIMIFPIVIMGIERLIDKKDGRLYGIALFYALYCNYYIAFMICIFSVIWYLFYSFRSVKQFFFRGLAFAGYSFLAAGMAAVLLLPAYSGIKQTASGDEMGLPVHSWLTSFADLLTRQFNLGYPISHDNFDGNANLFIGIFTVLAVILYFMNREISLLSKVKKGLLLILFYVSFSEEILNFIWHGFHNQYGIPNRFSFLFGFVLLTMVFELFEHKDCIRNWQAVSGCVIELGLLFYSRNYTTEPMEDAMYGLAGFLILTYGMILFILSFDHRHRKWHMALFSVIAMVEIGATAVAGFDTNGQISVSKFFYGTENMANATEALDDGTFFRSELADGKIVDENAWYRLNAVGLFGSTATDYMVNMMDSLGFYTGCNEYLYEGASPVTNLLLGVRYIYYHPEDTLHTDFQYKDSYGAFDVYENPTKGLSLGYMMDQSVDDWYYESAYPFRVQNDLCEKAFGVENVFETLEVEDPVTSGCSASRTNDGEYYFEYEEALADNMTFTIPINKDMDNLYVFYDGTQVENARIAVDGEIIQEGDIDSQILFVGKATAGSSVTVTFELKGETPTGYVRLSAANLNQLRYQELEERMTSQALQVKEYTDRYISGTVVAEKDQILFLSIPYDEGWEVVVDGKATKTEKIGDAFLAVPLSEGEHEVELGFTPDGFSIGWKISLICMIIFAGICAMTPRIRRKRQEKEEARLKKMLWEEEFFLMQESKNEESASDEMPEEV